MRLAIVEGLDVRDSRVHNYPPRWNGAPSQHLLYPAQSSNKRGVARSIALGAYPVLVRGPERRTQASQRQVRDRLHSVITMDANELVAKIHDRMPLIIAPGDYERWLSDEPDPHDLMRPFPASRCGCVRSRRGSITRERRPVDPRAD
jgi:hypothetical protein